MNKTTEVLKLAEEALVKANHFHDYEDALAAVREALAEQEKQRSDSEQLEPVVHYKKALDAWFEKTEWVQETAKPKELGMHRADVLKQRINELEKQISAPAKREWVELTDYEIGAVMDFGYATDSELENARDVIAAFKEKNK